MYSVYVLVVAVHLQMDTLVPEVNKPGALAYTVIRNKLQS